MLDTFVEVLDKNMDKNKKTNKGLDGQKIIDKKTRALTTLTKELSGKNMVHTVFCPDKRAFTTK